MAELATFAPPAGLAGRDLLSAADLSAPEILDLLEAAAGLKSRAHGSETTVDRPLAGRTVALVFDEPSLRTRVSFELAARQLGGGTIYLGPEEVGLGVRESAADVARTLERWVDALVVRTFDHGVVEEMADAARVPVINALTDREHPCQALADLLTLRERFGELRGLTVAFIGEANNVFRSLALAGCGLGLAIRLAHPPGYGPDPVFVAAVEAVAGSGGGLALTASPSVAVRGADAVYTDTWVSMGREGEADRRRAAFRGYRLDRDVVAHAPAHAIVMHCLPAHRGEEITSDVLDGPRSVAFDQSENRLHVQKALLIELLSQRPSIGRSLG